MQRSSQINLFNPALPHRQRPHRSLHCVTILVAERAEKVTREMTRKQHGGHQHARTLGSPSASSTGGTAEVVWN